MNFDSENKALKEGGIWSDKNVEESLDWQGETGGSAASEEKFVTHTPKTKKEIESEILRESQITPEIISIISSQVESRFLQKQAGDESSMMSILHTLNQKFADNDKSIRAWRSQVDQDLSKMNSAPSDWDLQINQINEKVLSLEHKIDALIASIAPQGAQEARMIQEAYEIIKNRQATEESDTGASDPSIFARFEQRVDVLRQQTQMLEPQFETTAERQVASVDRRKRLLNKLGRK
jgi:small-conductance mechanosensitive channel